MSKLIYVPLEAYQERYTEYQSVKGGVYETAFKKYKVPFVAIRPHTRLCHIKTGVVLDASKRCEWAFKQTQQLVQMIIADKITPEDVIYFEDFWHPGMEMIPYAVSLKYAPYNWPKIYSFWHAQSVDPHDFTFPMRHWMRGFENAWAECHEQIFIASKEVGELMHAGKVDASRQVVGLPYDSNVIKKLFLPDISRMQPKLKQVVFSSRWDTEKCPEFFCRLVDEVHQERNDIDFVVCTGAKELRSNSKELLDLAKQTKQHNSNFRIEENLTKKRYFSILRDSKVQFNCADQDFVSLTILDATTMGCYPLYPNYLTFPDTLERKQVFLYKKGDLEDAKKSLYWLIDNENEIDVSYIYKKHEYTVPRMLEVMGFIPRGTVPQLPEVVS